MTDATDVDESANDFTSILDLLALDRVEVAALATAIEREGIYTWDRYGRFVKAEKSDSAGAPSQQFVLEQLARYWNELSIPRPHDDPDLLEFMNDWHPDNYTHPLLSWGWTSGTRPDFHKLYDEFKIERHSTSDVPNRPKNEPAMQSKVWDVLAGLLQLHFGDSVIDDLRSDRSQQASSICAKLATKGVEIGSGTLKSYVAKK